MKKVVILVVVLYCFLLLLFYFFQDKVIFLPKKIDKNYTYTFPEKFEEINLKTPDGETINALHFKVANPKGIILYFHGNKGSLTRWGKIVRYFIQYGYDVFVMDYRGYGKSTGSFSENKMYQDAQLCYDFVKQRFSEDKIVVYGRSLGATFATRVAASNHPKELIIEAPFYSLKSVLNFYFSYAPSFLLKYQFNVHKDIVKVPCPITIFHGKKDQVTPYVGSQKLFQLLQRKDKQFISLKDGDHHNLQSFEDYGKTIAGILNK